MGKRKKKQNLNRARNMDIDAWRERQIRGRVQQRLDEGEREFMRQHSSDTDEMLVACVRRRAADLGRMPHPLELPGGIYIHKRLGDWDHLAQTLGLKPVGPEQGKKLYQQLMDEEEILFSAERRAIREAKKQNKGKAKNKKTETDAAVSASDPYR